MVRVIPQSLRLPANIQLASLGSFHKWWECAKSCERRSVCFCNRSGEGAGILAGSFEHRVRVLGCKVTPEIFGHLYCLTYPAAANKWPR